MGWSGGSFTRTNGAYSGANTWATDESNGFDIEAARHDTHDEDLADGIDNCLTKDGQNSPSDHLNWLSTELNINSTTGSSSNYVASLANAPGSYFTGLNFKFRPNHTNTGASTINVNGLGAQDVKKIIATDGTKANLVAEDLKQGYPALVYYDGTEFILINPGTIQVPSTLNVTSITSTDVTSTDVTSTNITATDITTTDLTLTNPLKFSSEAVIESGTTAGDDVVIQGSATDSKIFIRAANANHSLLEKANGATLQQCGPVIETEATGSIVVAGPRLTMTNTYQDLITLNMQITQQITGFAIFNFSKDGIGDYACQILGFTAQKFDGSAATVALSSLYTHDSGSTTDEYTISPSTNTIRFQARNTSGVGTFRASCAVFAASIKM